ncbi:MAG: diguanylate cyclase [Proteobacteria bacterium]|nr:diguanylate cyclase [Pseudomonadota bacterium]
MNQSNILVVDDHPENLMAMKRLLEQDTNLNTIRANSGHEALGLLMNDSFDLILLDIQMPGMDGFETAKQIRKRKKSKDIPIIFVTGFGEDPDYVRKGYELGAVDYIEKPIDPVVLKHKIKVFAEVQKDKKVLSETISELEKSKEELRMANKRLAALATSDPLTGLYNRRGGLEILKSEMSRVIRGKQSVSLIMMDLDHFKQVNDTYGHSVGDLVLVEIANRLKKTCRQYDRVVRWGGEELLIICPFTDSTQIGTAAERFHKVISEQPIEIPESSAISVTVSLGVASTDTLPDCSIENLISNADNALYQAKDSGRNCMRISYPEFPSYVVEEKQLHN